jgi:hypothetical protein
MWIYTVFLSVSYQVRTFFNPTGQSSGEKFESVVNHAGVEAVNEAPSAKKSASSL